MKRADLNFTTYIDFRAENDEKGCKLKIDNHVRIQKIKNIFAKVYGSNCLEEVFVIKRIRGHLLLGILTVKKLLESFTKKSAKDKSKTIQNRKSNSENM